MNGVDLCARHDGEDFDEYGSERENFSVAAVWFPMEDFGCHVRFRSDVAFADRAGSTKLSDTEVDETKVILIVDEDVLRFQVTMNDRMGKGMEVVEGCRHAHHVLNSAMTDHGVAMVTHDRRVSQPLFQVALAPRFVEHIEEALCFGRTEETRHVVLSRYGSE